MKKLLVLCNLLLLFGYGNQAEAQTKRENYFSKMKARTSHKEKATALGKKAALLPDSVESFRYEALTGQFATSPSTLIYSYDANGNVTEELSRSETGEWDYRTVNVYSGTLLTESHTYSWDGTDWLLESKDLTSYDAFGMDTSGAYYMFDPQGDSVLDYGWRTSLARDNFDRVTQITFYDLDGNDWIATERGIMSYNGTATTPFEIVFEEYDTDTDAGYNSFRGTQLRWDLGFDPSLDEGPSVYLGQEWNGTAWENSEYDSSVVSAGKVMIYFSHSYDDDLELFELSYSEHYQYDINGNAIVSLEFEYDGGIADTIRVSLDTFTYGSSAEILTHISMTETPFNPAPFGYREIYYYTNTSFTAPEKSAMVVYPNPVVSGQHIQLVTQQGVNQVSAYDSKGQLVKTWTLDESGLMATDGLMPGIYFLKANGADTTFSGRLLVR